MHAEQSPSLLVHFSSMTDPRMDRTKKHNLIDIFAIGICAYVAYAESWQDVENYGIINYEWLSTFLELPNKIPSHDTFARVFARLNPKELQSAFISWTQSIQECTRGKVVAIDGKTIRRSFDKATKCPAIHMVSAWSAANKLILGQVKTEEKSNEITAIPSLLELLNIHGAIVTIDAIGCQKSIAKHIINKKADYLLAVKDNHPELADNIKQLFNHAESSGQKETIHDRYVHHDAGHGRIETRAVSTITDMSLLPRAEEWTNLRCVCRVDSTRELDDKITKNTRYYISSLDGNAKEVGEAIREHWSIENSVHWVLDVTFTEDASRVRKDFGAENLAVLRRIALNLVKKEPSQRSMIQKRKIAGWDHSFLIKVLTGN